MNLWHTIRASIYSPAFYRSLATQRFSFSLKYFYSLGVALAIVFSATASFRALPLITQFIDRAGQAFVSHFPEELAIKIQNGEASTNVTEPYVLPLPDELKTETEKNGGHALANLLVIDTAAQASVEAWSAHDTYILVTKQNIITGKEPGGRIQIEWLSDFPNVTIDRSFVRGLNEDLQAVGRWIAPLVVFGTWFVFLVLWTFTLAYLLFGGLLAWLIARMRRMPVSYRTAYQMALHAWTPVALLLLVISGGLPGSDAPFIPTLLLIVVLIANIRPAPDESSPAIGNPASTA
ncbi:MAG: hypothetical protein RL681_80 [Candidatus Parcubacteria bacterium]|jgi:hypothetical protein